MKKICCLLALTILAGRPAFADDTPAAPLEKHNIVLGQTEKKPAQDTEDKKRGTRKPCLKRVCGR